MQKKIFLISKSCFREIYIASLILALTLSCRKKNEELEQIILNDKIISLTIWSKFPASQDDTLPYSNTKSTNVHGNPNNKGWDEAYPIGNGMLAAMIFGGVKRERIQLNEESLWSGKNHTENSYEKSEAIKMIRKLIFQNKLLDAQALAEQKLTGNPKNISNYQSLGDLLIDYVDIEPNSEYINYERRLSIDSALVTTKYTVAHRTFTREVFASYPNKTIVIHLTCDVPASINVNVSLIREAEAETFRSPYDSTLLIERGVLSNNNLAFEAQVKANYLGGTVDNESKKLIIRRADEVTIVISASTSFKGKDYAIEAKKQLIASTQKSYSELKKIHIDDYQNLYKKVKIEIADKTTHSIKPTTDLIAQNNASSDLYLSELMFQYGRYLMISSSREGSLPANMQGKWNEHLHPQGGSGYKTNWFLGLIYATADVANLTECRLPFLKFMETNQNYGKETAQKMYNSEGATAHDYVSIFGNNYPTTHQLVSISPMGEAWLANSVFEHYLYDANKELLKKSIYPILKNASLFYINTLQEISKNLPNAGKLVIIPSFCEEITKDCENNKETKIGYGSSIDQYLIYELFTNTLKAIDELSTKNIKFDPHFKHKLLLSLQKLTLPAINPKDGTINKWTNNENMSEHQSCFISQLYGLYPGSIINKETNPNLEIAAAKTMINDVGKFKNNNFTNALNAIWWSRLGNQREAILALNKQIKKNCSSNLLANDPPFSILGNFIFTQAFASLFVQNYGSLTEIMPAGIPFQNEGSIEGLISKGGFVWKLSWKNKLVKATFFSKNGKKCKLFLPKNAKISFITGKPVEHKKYENNVIELETTEGESYLVEFTAKESFKTAHATASNQRNSTLGGFFGNSFDLGIKF
jgi:alpha-L-fucosidase 2